MAEDSKTNPISDSDEAIFKDLLNDSRVQALHINEPQFDSFDVQSAIQEAKTVSEEQKTSRSLFGKLSRRNKNAAVREQKENPIVEQPQSEATKPIVSVDQTALDQIEPQEDLDDGVIEREITLDELLAGQVTVQKQSTQSQPVEEQASEVEEDLEPSFVQESLTVQEPIFVHQAEKTPIEHADEDQKSFIEPPVLEETKEVEPQRKPRTFAEILNSSRYQQNQQAIENIDLMEPNTTQTFDSRMVNEAFESEKAAQSSSVFITKQENNFDAPAQQEIEEQQEEQLETLKDDSMQDIDRSETRRGRRTKKNRSEVIDPDASLVDDYAYDEYTDKKHFFTSDYKKIEEYLANESAQGFHFTRKEGNRYFFVKKKPRNYLYKVLYFANEPDESYWQMLEAQGWDRVDQTPSRHKRDAGWYILRHLQKEGDLPFDIPNEEEKYRYFSKLASSCRSTLLLLVFVMICSAVSIALQYFFKGYLVVMIASAVLFAIALYIFMVYARMLSKARKQTSLLAARVRLSENNEQYQALQQSPQDAQYYEDQYEDEYED
ncbi:DUF2812 domain-containing protein [Allobaculum stercoricanis]|uniref:DUF2812 domain-containing protein n=1 Tax=Allobaculum stercoricanis TaxID=174709 RepID=UPI0029434D44|nr:DUF2812 domain-containing protein [Allobaculum stercoricanis]